MLLKIAYSYEVIFVIICNRLFYLNIILQLKKKCIVNFVLTFLDSSQDNKALRTLSIVWLIFIIDFLFCIGKKRKKITFINNVIIINVKRKFRYLKV